MDETAFLLAGIAFPLTTETPEFALDSFQWDTSGVVSVGFVAYELVARAPTRELVARAPTRELKAQTPVRG